MPPHAQAQNSSPRPALPGPGLEIVEALAAVDLTELGARIRRTRQNRSLTQTATCDGIISTAYLSRIESGGRRPNLQVLTALAQRLGSSAHELLLGLTPQGWSALEVDHDWAQLSLRTGDAERALVTTTRLLDELPQSSRLYRQALCTHALALEASGEYEQAATRLEELVESSDFEGALALDALTALSRMYRESGEFGRAIEVGDRAARYLDDNELAGTAEGLKLVLTVAAAHIESGAVGYAARLCQRALKHAEALGDPRQRAGCYWEASIAESRRGNHPEALGLAQRALHVLDEADCSRNTARLRTQLGILHLRMSPPEVNQALAHLEQAEREVMTSSASPADLADNQLAQALARFLQGDLDRARTEAQRVLDGLSASTPLLVAETYVLLGQIAFNDGQHDGARDCYQEAILTLSALGADRSAAQLWFQLGGLWRSVGCAEQALDAFERAGASTGLNAYQSALAPNDMDPRSSSESAPLVTLAP